MIKETLEDEIEDQIDIVRKDPRCKTIDAFIEAKLDDDEYEYNFIELQALARNIASKEKGYDKLASPSETASVKRALSDVGLKFIGREPIKNTRGICSPSHGTHPFAGSGGGGSGSGTSFEGPSFMGFGGGPGAIGGKYRWDPNDPKNLSMGTKTKKH
jgi:hypothetical protein